MLQTIRILIVDDDEDDYLLISEMIKEIDLWKGKLSWASNFDEAIQKINNEYYDVYIFDYRLREKSGLDLLKYAKQIGITGPIIILTGLGDREVDMEAMRLGASDYLVKTEITPQLLERSIRYSISQKNSEIEKDRLIEELKRAAEEIKTLSGLIPICVSCKRVRDDTGYWQQVEAYIAKHSNAEFSHGICPECTKKLYPEFYKKKKEEEKNKPDS